MMHPRDQWFTVQRITRDVIRVDGEAIVMGEPVLRESDLLHLRSPDYWHPDPRVRVAHHRRVSAILETACGEILDARTIVICEGDDRRRCPACEECAKDSEEDHAAWVTERESSILKP